MLLNLLSCTELPAKGDFFGPKANRDISEKFFTRKSSTECGFLCVVTHTPKPSRPHSSWSKTDTSRPQRTVNGESVETWWNGFGEARRQSPCGARVRPEVWLLPLRLGHGHYTKTAAHPSKWSKSLNTMEGEGWKWLWMTIADNKPARRTGQPREQEQGRCGHLPEGQFLRFTPMTLPAGFTDPLILPKHSYS